MVIVGPSASAQVTPQDGGTLASPGDRLRLDFGAGAVTETITTTIHISETRIYSAGSDAPVFLFRLEAEGRPDIAFQEPVTLTMDVVVTSVPAVSVGRSPTVTCVAR